MQKTAISTKQVFFLLTTMLSIIGHVLLVPVYFEWAGKDAWIGIFVSFLLGVLVFVAMGKLNEILYGETLIHRVNRWLGPWFGRILTLPLVLYFFLLSVITLYGFVDFTVSFFLTETPRWAVALSFGLAVFYLVHLGIEVIVRVSEWIVVIVLFTGIVVSAALLEKKDYTQLLPPLDMGIEPILPVIFLTFAVFGEMLVLLMVNVKKDHEKSISHVKVYLIALGVNLIIFLGAVTGPIAIFGEEQVKNFIYPMGNTVRLISLGFTDRLDSYGVTLLTAGSFVRLGIFHYATSLAISQWFSIANYRWINWILGMVLIITSLTMFNNYSEYYYFLKNYYPYGVVFTGVIIILWMLIAIMSKRKKRRGNY
ncbi:hypothetical protein P378_14875 [Desulforamulus profundi]|uniref:Spore germination protein n=1 Tax=Desulforamulus profundi TaxID=1383067 RepID=A0A2C6ME87_9FIRM|nr:endospore germination permease [Desulforamulus profundi]PHJ37626.1 hypothetical protein P378_14875 [Desulforamulus profundi]